MRCPSAVSANSPSLSPPASPAQQKLPGKQSPGAAPFTEDSPGQEGNLTAKRKAKDATDLIQGEERGDESSPAKNAKKRKLDKIEIADGKPGNEGEKPVCDNSSTGGGHGQHGEQVEDDIYGPPSDHAADDAHAPYAPEVSRSPASDGLSERYHTHRGQGSPGPSTQLESLGSPRVEATRGQDGTLSPAGHVADLSLLTDGQPHDINDGSLHGQSTMDLMMPVGGKEDTALSLHDGTDTTQTILVLDLDTSVIASHAGDEQPQSCWVSTLPDETRQRALSSCEPSTYLNDDVINAALEMVVSQFPRLRTFNTFQMASGGTTLQNAISCMLPLHEREGKANRLDHLILVAGFQPVPAHWALAWLDVDQRRADIYDSIPSHSLAPHRKVIEDLIGVLGKPYDEVKGWTIERAPFAAQPNNDDCGVYTIAAAFYRAAEHDPPGPTERLDGDLWRLLCKSILSDKDGSVVSILREYMPKLDQRVSLPSLVTVAETGSLTTNVTGTIQAHTQYIRDLKDSARNTYSTRQSQAAEMSRRLQVISGLITPVANARNDEATLRQCLEQLEANAEHVTSALSVLQDCHPVDVEFGQDEISFAEICDHLQSKLGRTRQNKKAIWARITAMQCGQEIFAAMSKAIGVLGEEVNEVTRRYGELMAAVEES